MYVEGEVCAFSRDVIAAFPKDRRHSALIEIEERRVRVDISERQYDEMMELVSQNGDAIYVRIDTSEPDLSAYDKNEDPGKKLQPKSLEIISEKTSRLTQ